MRSSGTSSNTRALIAFERLRVRGGISAGTGSLMLPDTRFQSRVERLRFQSTVTGKSKPCVNEGTGVIVMFGLPEIRRIVSGSKHCGESVMRDTAPPQRASRHSDSIHVSAGNV